ncbi:S-formylglutathione hydrolase [Stanieria cyanosphaera PCC 7437]|uniref:S-formylglutathione hydrolase n=1 Tax=Stanieria cyanosphaera (strain ATCC 29371 / PCC 7437) TaxID=111780 RepID=K9XTT2_STAC7|nr:S-formylglutathione hydrolase [Stanieria cyanosphaera]AFZ35486.1 S-formylglutathione hydrolase [Stanieria cyanosphaera PCC 7437]
MPNSLKLKSQHLCFGGTVAYYSHQSSTCHSEMNFAVYLPPQAQTQAVPILYYLSGLTCSEENFTVKAGAQRYAAEYGIMLVIPDTSPRQTGIPEEEASWDLGSGAGFYVDATIAPWQQYYQMYSYVTKELPALIAANFTVNIHKQGIFGHSMGGHGALICALKNPTQYLSVSAFAPICAPRSCPWGEKAFTAYLGTDREQWRAYDASELIKTQQLNYPILIDQGTADPFLKQQQLLPEVFESACQQVGQPLQLRYQEGYDHSYFTIATFMADHFRYHSTYLCQ